MTEKQTDKRTNKQRMGKRTNRHTGTVVHKYTHGSGHCLTFVKIIIHCQTDDANINYMYLKLLIPKSTATFEHSNKRLSRHSLIPRISLFASARQTEARLFPDISPFSRHSAIVNRMLCIFHLKFNAACCHVHFAGNRWESVSFLPFTKWWWGGGWEES